MKSTDSEWCAVLVVCIVAFLSQDVHGIQTQLSGSWFGRVEVLRQDTNQWGTICRNDFTDSEAAAVCKSLNYATGKSVNTWLHQASRPIHFDQVSCGNGSHDNIGTCLYGGVPLDNLNITEWGDFSSLNCEDAVVFCWNVSEPEFRLVPGPNYGRVEMAIDGNWGTICSRHWHWQDARVLCKELGFIDGMPISSSSIYGQGSGNSYFGYPQCSGSEDSILNCRYYGPTENLCGHHEDVAVFCSESVNNSIVYRENWGRVEFWKEGSWNNRRPVCDGNFTDIEATVVCRERGFNAGHAVCCGSSDPWGHSDSKTDWLCTGNEARLLDCPHTDASCSSGHSASVVCYNSSIPQDEVYTLNHGSYGYVRMTYKGVEGLVCDTNWTREDALVACRSLGYDGALNFPAGFYGRDSSHKIFWLKDPVCAGSEDTLLECPSAGVGGGFYPECHWNDGSVGVFCYQSNNVGQFDVRLSDFAHTASYGRLEVMQFGDWGAVSVPRPSPQLVKVACRELGYDVGIGIHGNPYSRSTRPVWYHNVTCTGDELSLQNCTREPPGKENEWSNDDDIFLYCWNSDSVPVPSFRLHSSYYGRVEVTYGRYAGVICKQGWDDVDADVLCRNFGYKRGMSDPELTYSANYPVYYVNVSCNGSESSVKDCDKVFGNIRPEPGYCDVTSSTPAAAFCFQKSDYGGIEFRLAHGHLYEGRVEMSIDEIWGTVCKVQMTTEHAGIICRQLGFDDGKLATVSSGSGNVWLRLRDSCSLAHIQDCPRYGFGMTHCGHGHDIGIYCYDITNASCEAPAALTGHFGHLRSFGHPTTQYGPNLNCTWWITVPEGFAVRLTFTDFSLEDSVDCENDYVEVRDIGMGSFENWTSAAVIGRYCGATNPGTLTSTTNRLVVHFRSNEATSSGGMAAYFSSDCSGATVWNKVNSTSDLSGTDFMIRSINNASNCLLECDQHQFCFKVYYDATNETCYMKMATFYGRNISLSGLELETYEKKCINGHQWTTQDNRAIRSEELAVEYTSNVDNCLASCRMRPTCLAIDYNASSKKCTLHSVNSADTSLTLESSTVYHETTVPKTCAEVLANNGTSGWYGLKVATGQLVFTYCDALRFGGGWTLLMAKRARSCTSPVSELPVSQYSLLESEFSILQELLRFKDRTLVDYYELLLEDSGRQWNSTWMVPNTMSDYNDVTVTSFEGVTSMLGMARGHIQSLAHISAISNISGLPYIGENCSSPVTDASNTIFLWMRTPTTANKDKKCVINVCANGGHCRYENGNTTCTCAKGFYGEKCEHSLPSVTAQFKKLPDTAVRFADITKTKVSTRVLDCMSFCVLHGCSGFYWQPKTEVKPMNCELLSEQLFGSLLYSEVHRDVYVRLQEGDIDWEQ